MKKLMQRFKNERGLTLVELLAVIVILAIIAVIAFVMIGIVIDNSKKDAHIANAQQLISSAKLYESQGGDIPNDGVPHTTLIDDGMIDELINPWNASGSYSGTVKKVGSEYKVTMTGDSTGKCEITDRTEKQLAEGRKTICP